MFSLSLAIPGSIAIGMAMGVAMLLFLQYRLGALVSAEWRATLMVVVVGIGAFLSVALTSRTLSETRIEQGVVVMYEDFADGFAASRWLSLVLLAASLMEVARGWAAARAAAQPDPARPIIYALLAYYFGTLLIQGLASEHTGFSYKALYVPIMLTGAYYLPVRHVRGILEAAKGVMLLLTLGSLGAAVAAPDFVLHRPDPGLLPGIDWRLYGLTSHANTLAPIALLAIVVELHSPSRLQWLRWVNLSAAVAVFVLAQSKTTWGAAPVILAAVYLPFWLRPGRDAAQRGRHFNRFAWTLVVLIAGVLVLTGALIATDAADYVQRKADLATLTGRTQIWDITLQAWRENLLFGWGPEVWGAERRLQFLMFHVGHAHNQVMQTLGEAGLVGLALLLTYLGVLLYAALRRFVATRGVVLALLILMLVRCITEAPMRAEGLLSWATFLHLLLLILACHALRRPVGGVPGVAVVPTYAAANEPQR